jgi:beta-lactamase superfamily II metal-dependent hydrolase
MRRAAIILALILFVVAPRRAQTPESLQIHFVDVEGGQATLFVTPSGESLLIDTGFPGNDDRDLDRVLDAIKSAGLKSLDYLLVTHYHSDHVGNAAAIASRIPVGTFVDHGDTVETTADAKALYDGYLRGRATGKHLQVKPGDKLPIKGFDVTIVSAGGEHIATALQGGGQPNPQCASYKPKDPDPSENARSVGSVITFGRFRMLDLGDLTWNKEHDLVCPNNLIGPIDLYLTTHHGLDQSGAPVLVRAIQPRVAIMNNGPKKGGSAEAIRTVRSAPGLLDFWQVHYAMDSGDANMPPAMIANLDDSAAHGIDVTARRDGSFTVTNQRTKETRAYKPR